VTVSSSWFFAARFLRQQTRSTAIAVTPKIPPMVIPTMVGVDRREEEVVSEPVEEDIEEPDEEWTEDDCDDDDDNDDDEDEGASASINELARSAKAITVAWIFPFVTAGMTEASATRNPCTPRTCKFSLTTA